MISFILEHLPTIFQMFVYLNNGNYSCVKLAKKLSLIDLET